MSEWTLRLAPPRSEWKSRTREAVSGSACTSIWYLPEPAVSGRWSFLARRCSRWGTSRSCSCRSRERRANSFGARSDSGPLRGTPTSCSKGSRPAIPSSPTVASSSARKRLGAAPSLLAPAFLVGGLEELDGITGRVVEQDLRAADAGQDVVTKPQAGSPKPRDLAREVGHRQLNAIPPT